MSGYGTDGGRGSTGGGPSGGGNAGGGGMGINGDPSRIRRVTHFMIWKITCSPTNKIAAKNRNDKAQPLCRRHLGARRRYAHRHNSEG
ncbi:hypothetical protein FS800_12600 [Agrobacterium vitis]|nr:hypothetical protein [Allorhizobium ampelinum]